jgi:uncharacterized delta-60 repeat protein
LVQTFPGGIQRFDKTGNFLGIFGQYGGGAGMAFRFSGNLLAAYFASTGHGFGVVKEFDTKGNEVGNFADFLNDNDGYNPKSLAIDIAGNVYVGTDLSFGQTGGELVKYNHLGARLQPVFSPAVENDGVSRIALAADQCTIYYTSAGVAIKRFNVCTQSQLPDFVSGGASPKRALQIRGNGDVLVQSDYEIDRYDSSGRLQDTYPYPTELTTLAGAMDATTNTAIVNDASGIHIGDDIFIDNEPMTVSGLSGNTVTVIRNINGLTATSHLAGATVRSAAGAQALALDPDGKHFWAGGAISFTGRGSPVYKYDIDSGGIEVAFYAGFPVVALTVFGLADTDGDGLPDDWERYGVTVDSAGNVIGVGNQTANGGIFIDLPSMGADPLHKDLFVHADWMNGDPSRPTVIFKPTVRALKIVMDSFARAPVDNPDGKRGINIHIDGGPESPMKPGVAWRSLSQAGAVPFQGIIGSRDSDDDFVWTDVDNSKQLYFNPAGRQKIFRYALFADSYADSGCSLQPCASTSSGLARAIPGSDFLVTLGLWSPPGGTYLQQAGTFMHELGHTLGFKHGGIDDVNDKPNYLSVMNYTYQIIGIPKPFTNPYSKNPTQRNFDYSRLALPVLNPSNPVLDEGNLDETIGISDPARHFILWNRLTNTDRSTNQCLANPNFYRLFFPNAALDWNCNGIKDTAPVVADISGDGICVTPGTDKILESTAQGDDVVINRTIVAGPNRTCESSASGDDVQVEPVGHYQAFTLVGFNDWPTLVYNGGGTIGLGASTRSSQNASMDSTTRTTKKREEPPLDMLQDFVPQSLIDEELTAPLDNVSYSPAKGQAPLTVNFDGTASTANNGATIVDWFWDFGDGTTGSGATVNHTYRTGGDFYANLTVTDSNGQVNLVPLLNLVSIDGTSSAPQPNIVSYQPPGWSDRIVVSNMTGTNTDTPVLTSTDTLYVDWAVINNGQAATNTDFIVTLYVDGVARQNFLVPHPLDVNSYAFSEDYRIGTLSAGGHAIKIVADSTGVIDPAGQTHNEYSRFITVTGAAPVPTPTATPTATPNGNCVAAQITSPANGSNIQSTTTFNWSAATGASRVSLHIGTQGPGSVDIYGADQGTNTSVTISNLVGTIYVRLTTYCPDPNAQFGFDIITFDYVYQGPSPAPTPTPAPGSCVAAQMVSPAPGSVIQPTTTFTWSAGTGNSAYYLFIGTKEAGSDELPGYDYNNQTGSYQGKNTSVTVRNLPGGTIYAQLRSSCSGTATNLDYTYNVPLTAVGTGSVDSMFRATATENGGQVRATLVQPDGKIVVGGQFKSFAGCARSGIARLNADGTCDQTFDPGLALSDTGDDVGAIVGTLALQADGKILVGLRGGTNAWHHGLYRFNSDGTLDPKFNANLGGNGFPDIESIAVQPDGQILVAGAFLGQPNGTFTTLARLNPDGSFDPSFVRMVHGGATPTAAADVVALKPDGKIIVGGTIAFAGDDAFGAFVLARLNSDGTRDNAFHAPICQGSVPALALQSDGKIVAVGGLTFIGSDGSCDASVRVARFNSDGTRDTSYSDPFVGSSGVQRMAIQEDGKTIVTSHSGFQTATGDFVSVARLNLDGTLDVTFPLPSYVGGGPAQGGSVYTLSLMSGGKILLAGGFNNFNGSPAESIVQVNSDGSINSSFAPNGPGGNAEVVALLQQPDGKWLVGLNPPGVAGGGGGDETTKLNGITSARIGRLNADGTTDTTFTSPPFAPGSVIVGLARQTDGKVIVSGKFYLNGSSTDVDLLRLNPDGSVDTTFTPPSYAGNGPVLIQPSDGKIIVAGFSSRELILRLNPTGTLDTTLQDLGQSAGVASMLLQGDGKLLIGGFFNNVQISPGQYATRNNIARLNQDGSADLSFDPGTGVADGSGFPVRTISLQPDGKILIGGSFYGYNGTAMPEIARLNSTGSLDTSFVPVNPNTATFSPAQAVGAIALQTDGKIIVGPNVGGNPTSPMSIFRLNPDGSLDQTFALRSGIAVDPTASATRINAFGFQSGGTILVGGNFDVVNGEARMGLARLLPDTVNPAPTPAPAPSPTPTPRPTPTPLTLQFSSATYNVNEGCVTANITVNRSGDPSGAVTVGYATSDGTAQQRTDYSIATGAVNFASGETSKTFPVLITKDAYNTEGPETVNLMLSNPTGGASLGSPSTATLIIMDDTTVPATSQPIDDATIFVCQHYHDFLAREPDQAGFNFWVSQITLCGSNQSCINSKRIDVSNAFFFELEYQQTAAYVFRLYRAAYGNSQPFPNPDDSNQTEANKLPSYTVFAQDRARLIGSSNLAQDQLALATLFASRAEFTSKYSASLTLDQFVDAVLATIQAADGVDLTSQRSALIALGSRGAVLYRLANDDLAGSNGGISNRGFVDAEYNRAFVASQYFGYLRRDADIGGFLFWLGQVGRCPIRNVGAQHAMVCSFITSAEYENRFSAQVTHMNGECPQGIVCSQ